VAERDPIGAIVRWLEDGARSASAPDAVLEQLCQRLVACGLPLARVAVFVRTLHPQIMGRRFLWRPGAPVETSSGSYALMADDDFRNSPVVHVYATGAAFRRRLIDRDCPIDFPVLRSLVAAGETDYFATPLVFVNGEIHVATWSTRDLAGFRDHHIDAIEAVVAPLARIAEIYALRRTAGMLLDTYVGGHAGARILAGQIRRGDIDTIQAAIWLSDMRDFTARADGLAPRLLIDLLNRYFDAQVPAILERGGEVLKFMGDGLLAIFPIGAADGDRALACAAALAAARDAHARIATLDPPAAAAQPPSASASRSISARYRMAISAARPGSTSPASVPPSISPRGSRR
jgi:adenylate cyclase